MRIAEHIKYILPVCLASLVVACGSGKKGDDEVLAKVGDVYLYQSELEGTIQPGLSPQDSIKFTSNYVDNWINRQILIQEAGQKVKDVMDKIDRQVSSYRNDLVLAEYEQQYLQQKLDTIVTGKQIQEFYTANKTMFELRDYVVNVFYLKFPSDEKDINRIGNEVKKCPDEKSAAEIDKKYSAMASNSYFEPGNWLFLNDLLREIPLEIEDKTRFMENTPYVEVKTDEFVYLVRIFDYKLKNDISPLDLVSNKIKTLILRKRSKDLLDEMRSGVIKQYKNENDVENYVK